MMFGGKGRNIILKNIKKSGRDLSKDYTINSELEDIEMEVRFHTENEQKKILEHTGRRQRHVGCSAGGIRSSGCRSLVRR